jgi:hypothetical protein
MLMRIVLMSALCVLQAAVASAQLIISEYRVRGPNGVNDEFIELRNNSGSQHVVAGGGTGYALAASDGTARCVVPNGTVIPARGHYLCINSVGYSLASYPAGNGTTGTGDATYSTDIPDNAGLALFNTSVSGSFTLGNRMDAAGSAGEANTLYKEGTGVPTLGAFNLNYAFVRRSVGGCTGSGGGASGNCDSLSRIQTTPGPATTQVQDTNNNAADFIFLDINGTSAGAGQRLGAPGPESSFSPVFLDGFALAAAKLDTCAGRHRPPNVVRDFTSDPGNNATFGTFDIRRRFTNTTGIAITRLRFRILDITTYPPIPGVSDLRPRTSADGVVTVDRPPCGTGTSNPTVRGTALEQPPDQPNGSGFNGSLSVTAITPAAPLAAGGSVDVRFLLGIERTGASRFCVAAETIPATSSQVVCVIGTGDGLVTLSETRSDFDGDGAADIAVYRPSTGHWFVRNQGAVQFGDPGDIPMPGDFNDDGGEDIVLYRPSTGEWFALDDGVQFGDRGDVPVSGDFNGDGRTDVTVYRPSTGHWFVANLGSVQFGGPGFVPVPADYNGDGVDDLAVFQPSTGNWFVRDQSSVHFGDPGDRPIPGDYDDDGKADIAVYRPSTGQWFVRNQFTVQFGDPGDVPVPRDYDGNGALDVAIYRPSTGQWFVKDQFVVQFGDPGDMPIPRLPWIPLAIAGDYDGDGATDVVVHRPTTNEWFVRNQFAIQFGDPGDIPIPADYNGDRRMDLAVYRAATGHWFVRNQFSVQFGDPSDRPVPADYNGDGLMDVAVYRPSTGTWFARNQFAVQFGDASDVPVPGDYNADGFGDIAVYRPSSGQWFVRNIAAVQFGDPGDIPVPADYNGDGRTDLAVYRPSTRTWFVRNQLSVQFGDPGDVPVPGDYNGDGLTDIAVYRPSTGQWFVRNRFSVSFGDATHVPMVRIGGPQ